MKIKKGFTLLELLITATLLSILAVFGAGMYRNSMRQAKLANLQNQARIAAYGIQQFKEEFPGNGGNPVFDGTMSIDQRLFDEYPNLSSFLERGMTWGDGQFWGIVPCEGDGDETDGNMCEPTDSDPNFRPLVCLVGDDPQFDDAFNAKCYAFCVNETGEREFHNPDCEE